MFAVEAHQPIYNEKEEAAGGGWQAKSVSLFGWQIYIHISNGLLQPQPKRLPEIVNKMGPTSTS